MRAGGQVGMQVQVGACGQAGMSVWAGMHMCMHAWAGMVGGWAGMHRQEGLHRWEGVHNREGMQAQVGMGECACGIREVV